MPYSHFHDWSFHTHHRRPKGGNHYRAFRRRQRPWRIGATIAMVLTVVAGAVWFGAWLNTQGLISGEWTDVGIPPPLLTLEATATQLPEIEPPRVAPTALPPSTATAVSSTLNQSVRPTSTRAPTLTPTGTLAPTVTSSPTHTPSPTQTPPTATPTIKPTSIPTATPMPDELLILDAAATVEGYWSDGTANLGLKLTLRNEGNLAQVGSQSIEVTCTLGDNAIEGCSAATEISLPDGFGPVATDLTLRVPTGLLKIDIDYGGDARHFLSVNVPERILGVDRNTWECYSDRSVANNAEGDHGCYGWYEPTVEKWRSGSTVRVWATGNDNYIRAFRETLDEQLSEVLNLTFEWVENERDADYVAILGVSKSDARPDRWANCAHAWGCGGPIDVRGGEVRQADMILYHLDYHDRFLNDYAKLKRLLNGIFIHEALHGLAPTGHADRSGVALSVMRSAGYLTSIDKAILSLNSHPLVEPGMAMSQVEPLIVFKDELLDPPKEPEPTPYDLMDRTLATLQKVDTVRMKIRGGWSGGRCDRRFGKRQWATLEIAGFDAPDDPRLAHLQDDNDRFFIFHSDEAAAARGDGWQHWQESRGVWKLISREELWDSTAWWVRNSKLHSTISELLQHYDQDDIELVEQSDGWMTLSAEYNPSEIGFFELKDEQLTFTAVIDEDSYEVQRFHWTHHNREWDYCHTYTEEGIDLEYGVEIEIPEAVVEGSKYALPVIKTNGE